ncbi:MAG: hypothetical protein J6T84_07845 [Spirochaetaceae bacterium]|nr:hypothetical protein [Spirochaetaceae bacterium]
MKKTIQFIYIIISVFIMLIPIINFNWKESVSEKEKRTLAKVPEFNSEIFKSCDLFVQDRFGGRNELIKLSNFIDYNVLCKRVLNDKAFKGKNDFYYLIDYGDGWNIMDFYKKNLLEVEELTEFKEKIKKTVSWCEEQGIKYLFVIGPNKHSIYPENYLSKRPDGISRIDQITEVFDELKIPYVFPREYLIEKKNSYTIPLYYETDTHWNLLGGYCTSCLIKEKLKELFPKTKFPEIEYDINVEYTYEAGDILPMLGIERALCTNPILSPKGASFTDYYELTNPKNRFEYAKNKIYDELPKAIVFGDSFALSIKPYLPTMFSETQFNYTHFSEAQKEYILSNKPDIIIFEKVERVAPWCVE